MNPADAITRLRTLLPPGSTLYAVTRGRSRSGGSMRVDFLALAWHQRLRDAAAPFRMEWVTPHLIDAGVLPHGNPLTGPVRVPQRGKGVRVREPLDRASSQILEALGAVLYPGSPASAKSVTLEWL